MKTKLKAFALGCFGFFAAVVIAAPVSEQEALLAAAAWAHQGRPLGEKVNPLGVAMIKRFETDAGEGFYLVRMREDELASGALILAADTDFEPVIFFTQKTLDIEHLDPAGPLWALISRDLKARRQTLSARPLAFAAAPTDSGYGKAPAGTPAARWQHLIAEGERLLAPTLLMAASNPVSYLSGDPRVATLLQSKWDQGNAGGGACFNYYTPQDRTGVIKTNSSYNVVCGCVATAMSQIMYYHRYPVNANPVGQRHDPRWEGEVSRKLELDVSGKDYAWDKMVSIPGTSLAQESREAIGLLTSDAGRAVGMGYSRDGSGAYDYMIALAFTEVFRYQSAVYTMMSEFMTVHAASWNAIYANLDAGYPVVLGISRTTVGADGIINRQGGHCICADGYGFDQNQVAYVHLNMGWSGSGDAWYALPDIPAGGYAYNSVDDIVYNIFPQAKDMAIMSGRITDSDGAAVVGAKVSVRSYSGDISTNVTSQANGVWAVLLPAGFYQVSATDAEGVASGQLDGYVFLNLPDPNGMAGNHIYYVDEEWNDSVKYVSNSGDLGNSWGNDIVVRSPSVRIVGAGHSEDETYDNLDQALDKVGDWDRVEVFKPTRLRSSREIKCGLSIVAAPETEGDEVYVAVNREAQLTIGEDARVFLTNITFRAVAEDQEVVLTVRTNGCAVIGGALGFNRINTTEPMALEIAAPVTLPVFVNCTSAGEEDPFAVSHLSADSFSGWANNFLCTFDEELVGTVTAGSEAGLDGYPTVLVWHAGDLPDSAAIVQLVVGDTTKNYRSLEVLFKHIPADPEVLVRIKKPCAFTARYNIPNGQKLIFLSEEEPATVVTLRKPDEGDTAHIMVGAGAELVLSNIVFTGEVKGSFIDVNGGTADFQAGTVFKGIVGINDGTFGSDARGWLQVMEAGRLMVQPGVVFDQCQSLGGKGGYGGAMFVNGGEVHFMGGVIRNCKALHSGGGVYVGRKNGTQVTFSGDVQIFDNLAEVQGGGESRYGLPSDVYSMMAPENFVFVDGLLAETAHIGMLNDEDSQHDNNAGMALAKLKGDGSGNSPEQIAAAFFNNTDSTLEAVRGEDNATLVWAKKQIQTLEVDESEAVFAVQYEHEAAAGTWHYYQYLEDAFSEIYTNCLVQHRTDWAPLRTKVVVPPVEVTLMSALDERSSIERSDEPSASIMVPKGASLTLTNIVISGVQFDEGGNVVGETAGGRLLAVDGGTLILADGAAVGNVDGALGRDAAGVVVWNRGVFRMESGSEIFSCINRYEPEVGEPPAVGGGLSLNRCTAYLYGGTIHDCTAPIGSGVFLGNGAKLHLKGDITIKGNGEDGRYNNLEGEVTRELHLDGPLTGEIGYTLGNAVQVGDVFGWATTNELTFAEIDESAAKIFRDADSSDYGVAVTNCVDASDVLLVWNSAVQGGYHFYTTDAEGNELHYVRTSIPAGMTLATPKPVTTAGFSFGSSAQPGGEEEPGETKPGEVTLSFGNGVAGCVYTLKETTSLDESFKTAERVELSEDGPVSFTRSTTDADAKFWTVNAEAGLRKSESSSPTLKCMSINQGK